MATAGASRILQSELVRVQPCRLMGRRAPKPGKPPILPPSKKVCNYFYIIFRIYKFIAMNFIGIVSGCSCPMAKT